MGLLWLGAGGFLAFVLMLASSPKDVRNLGASRGGSSPLANVATSLGRAMLEVQALVEPEKRHLADAGGEEATETDDEGEPPQAGPTSRER